MKIARSLLALGTASLALGCHPATTARPAVRSQVLLHAAAHAHVSAVLAAPAFPLAGDAGRPAVGNVGQRGRLELSREREPSTPLVNERERPMCGNIVTKGGTQRVCQDGQP